MEHGELSNVVISLVWNNDRKRGPFATVEVGAHDTVGDVVKRVEDEVQSDYFVSSQHSSDPSNSQRLNRPRCVVVFSGASLQLSSSLPADSRGSQFYSWLIAKGLCSSDADKWRRQSALGTVLKLNVLIKKCNDAEPPHDPDHCGDADQETPEGSKRWLTVCSRATAGCNTPLLQPRFVFTYFHEIAHEFPSSAQQDPSSLLISVCGPCAYSCLQLQHIAILDSMQVTRSPFVCGCHNILKSGHACKWRSSPAPAKCIDTVGSTRMQELWRREHATFLKAAIREKMTLLSNQWSDAEEKFTAAIRSQASLFPQFRDADAQRAALAVVPVSALHDRANASLKALSGTERSKTDLFDAILLELLRWFKGSFFKWVDQPACDGCGHAKTSAKPVNGQVILTPEERANWCSTVELYECESCKKEVRFPRYNNAKRLLSWRRGRCGEWTLCFLLIATAMGYECRLVLDLTDHVWAEVYSLAKQRWVHCDPCEAAYDQPMLYEEGWKKQLSYIFALSDKECVDVIRRYSKHAAGGALAKRNTVTELFCQSLLRTLDADRLTGGNDDATALFAQRRAAEVRELLLRCTPAALDSSQLQGRTTGSDQWRRTRGEDGASAITNSNISSTSAIGVLRDLYGHTHIADLLRRDATVAFACQSVFGGQLVTTSGKADNIEFEFPAEVRSDIADDVSLPRARLDTGFALTLTAYFCSRQSAFKSRMNVQVGPVHVVITATGSEVSVTVDVDWRLSYRGGSPPEFGYPRQQSKSIALSSQAEADVSIELDGMGGCTVCIRDSTASSGPSTTLAVMYPLPEAPGYVPIGIRGLAMRLSSVSLSASLE